jgi:hypothetical protein
LSRGLFAVALRLSARCPDERMNVRRRFAIRSICLQLDNPVRREAADPAIVLFDDEYWLFVSKSGGSRHSSDFQSWIFRLLSLH